MQNRDLDTRLTAQEAEQAEFQNAVIRDYALAQRIRLSEISVQEEGPFLEAPSSADEVTNTADATAFATESELTQPTADGGDAEAGLYFEIEAMCEVTAHAAGALKLSLNLGGVSGTELASVNWTPAANDEVLLKASASVVSLGSTGLISGESRAYATGETDAFAHISEDFDFDTTPQPSINVVADWASANSGNTVELIYLRVRKVGNRTDD